MIGDKLSKYIYLPDLHMAINFLGLPVSPKETSQNPHPSHPSNLLRHTGIGCTFSLTYDGKEKVVKNRMEFFLYIKNKEVYISPGS